MNIVFMGTPDFSVPILEALHKTYNVKLVVSQPDKPQGRHHLLIPTPVKKKALELDIPVFQPVNIKDEYERIILEKPDIIITAAYGQKVPKVVLDYPKYKCINVHASLLPKYRGGAPIHRALINGDKETGISIMYMADKMDAGDIINQKKLLIEDSDNVLTLFNKLSFLGRDLLLETLPEILSGEINVIRQDESQVVIAKNIKREEELLDFNKTGWEVYNKIRGLSPWPVSYFLIDGIEVKVFEAEYVKMVLGAPKEIVEIKKRLGIQTKDAVIYLKVIQISGKKKMNVSDYLNGQHLFKLNSFID